LNFGSQKGLFVKDLIDQIRNGNDVLRKQARLKCIEMGETIVPDLLELLNSEQAAVRHTAVKALGVIADQTAAYPLRLCIAQETNVYTRGQAVVALTNCIGKQAIPDLLNLLDDIERGRQSTDKRICDYAAEGLARIGTSEIRSQVEAWAISQLAHDTYVDKVAGLSLLRRIGTEQAFEPVKRALYDYQLAPSFWRFKGYGYRVCDAAADTLVKIAHPTVCQDIESWAIDQLLTEDRFAAHHAMELLLTVGTERCVPYLLTWMLNTKAFIYSHSVGEFAASVLDTLQLSKGIQLTEEQRALFRERRSFYAQSQLNLI
jgi:HEAT repeat protein